jgi:hypothetical protein
MTLSSPARKPRIRRSTILSRVPTKNGTRRSLQTGRDRDLPLSLDQCDEKSRLCARAQFWPWQKVSWPWSWLLPTFWPSPGIRCSISSSRPWQAAREAAAKRTRFFTDMVTLTAFVVFPSWPVFIKSLATFEIPRKYSSKRENPVVAAKKNLVLELLEFVQNIEANVPGSPETCGLRGGPFEPFAKTGRFGDNSGLCGQPWPPSLASARCR